MKYNINSVITLNNGVKMPQTGLGTFLIPHKEIGRTIAEAYEKGYRQFDTAWRYHNECDISKALKDNGIHREDVFITTKVNIDALYFGGCKYGKHSIFNVRRSTIKSAIEESFKNLGTDYIDLFLVHWPWTKYRKMYAALTDIYHEGRIHAIGVCSCLPPHIEALSEVSDVVPAVNQFEISPLNTQKHLIKYCKEKGIAVEAMSTFSHFRSNEPRKDIIDNEHIRPIAKKYGKSIPQVILRWLIQQDIIIIPKTWDSSHLNENISIFDFELTSDEMAIIDFLDKGKFLNYDPYTALKALPPKYNTWKGFNNELK